MPFESEAQRRFMYAKHPKLAKEFEEATPKGADLPEHVKKENMADGGEVMPDIESSAEAFNKGMEHENVTHDSDAVKSYLASKFHSLLHPMGDDQAPKPAETAPAPKPEGMSDGGYPHVTFMENMPQEQVEKVVHMEDSPNMEHERQKSEVYKAMGMEKYAGGGFTAPAPAETDMNMPNPQDPTYWDQIKAALSKIGAPLSPLAVPAQMASGTANAVAPTVAPAAVSAINRLAGTSLPVPPAPTPKTPDLATPEPLSVTVPTPEAASKPPATSVEAKPATGTAQNDLKDLYSQDTSKLTQGVEGEDRQKVADTMNADQRSLGSIVAQAVAGLGDALSAKGGREQHSLKDIFAMQKQQRDEALANFDKARQARLEKLDLQTKMGDNTVKKLAAQDAYGVDEHLNKMLGAPAGTAHKDLPLYMQTMTAKLAQQEKDSDLYMRAHKQAADEVEASIKNAGMFNFKPSPEQIKAAGAKLADNYYNRAKGNVLFQPSDGQKPLWIPAANVEKARKMDPNGRIIP